MSHIKQFPLRKIAENVLVEHLGDLDVASRDDLAVSLVRQWITHEGHAGFVMPTRQFWFRMVAKGDRVEVGVTRKEGNWGRILVQDWHVAAEEVPGLLHQLNLCQSVLWRTVDGPLIHLSIGPEERAVRCREQADEDA